MRPPLSSESVIRVILGPQAEAFTAKGVETFLGNEYRISPKSDRQGFRTEGPPVETIRGSDIITDPTPLGAVQVPGDGQPIILLRDGQVTGGYAKIATVISADLDKFGQMSPGDKVRFQAVTREEALHASREARRNLKYLTVALS
jgi:allophanate hydrolase subunit 2